MLIPYPKQWLSLSDQRCRLQSYGLTIHNNIAAEQFLQHINYYRFCGYGLAFEQSRHNYIPGTTFNQIRQAYEFDRALRDLITESLEIIELDIRTAIAYTFTKTHGPFGHVTSNKFIPAFKYDKWKRKIRDEAKRSREVFIRHFKNTYSEFPDLPLWAVTEVISFGALSTMYTAMLSVDQKPVSARYGLQPGNLGSILHHLVYIRNLCAHHSRIWDREWAIKPSLPAGRIWRPPSLPDNRHIFVTLLIQSVLLRKCPAEKTFYSDWRTRVEELIANQLPAAPNSLARMGLTPAWQTHPLWTEQTT